MKKITAPTKTKFFAIISFLGFSLLALEFAPLALAQSALGLTAIPPRLEITVNPGEVITKEIKIRNESSTEKTISTSTRDFIVTDDLGTPLQIETTDQISNRWTASTWIQISPSQLKLKPGETKSLLLTVIAPDDALAGGHYAVVLHTPNNEATLTQTGASVETNVGTLVYLTVPGDITQNASIREFSAPRFSEYGPVDFKTTITNLSDIHITPAGAINIYNTFGLKSAQINLDNTNIFPGTSRDFINTLSRKIMLGRYKAQINATYGTTGQLLTATLFFWVIPYKLIALLLAVIIIIFLIIKLQKKAPPLSELPKVEELEKELEDLKKKYQDRK
jgi:hypothetical protein